MTRGWLKRLFKPNTKKRDKVDLGPPQTPDGLEANAATSTAVDGVQNVSGHGPSPADSHIVSEARDAFTTISESCDARISRPRTDSWPTTCLRPPLHCGSLEPPDTRPGPHHLHVMAHTGPDSACPAPPSVSVLQAEPPPQSCHQPPSGDCGSTPERRYHRGSVPSVPSDSPSMLPPPRHSAPHRTCSASYVVARHGSSCGPPPSSGLDPTASTTSLGSPRTTACSDALPPPLPLPVEYGMPGWERHLTAHIAAACSAVSGSTAASSRRASYTSAAGAGAGAGMGAGMGTASSATLAALAALQLHPMTPAALVAASPPRAPPPSAAPGPQSGCSPDLRAYGTAYGTACAAPCPGGPPFPGGYGCPPSPGSCPGACFPPVVLPAALVAAAAAAGADLHLDLARDLVIDEGRPLGAGQFGAVYAGSYRGAPVAVKLLRPVLRGCSIEDLEVFVQEITVLSTLRHDNIIRLLAACLQPPAMCLVEELAATSLDALLHGGAAGQRTSAAGGADPRVAAVATDGGAAGGTCPTDAGAGALTQGSRRRPPLPLHRVLEIALDVAHGLQYLHGRTPAVVHRDLKPSNILLDAAGRAKISDFGLARCKYEAVLDTNRPETGSMAYMAPECWDPSLEGGLCEKCDIFSFGVLLWELVTGERPWAGYKMSEFVTKVVARGARLPVPTDDTSCPLALRALISACTEERPAERPALAAVLADLARMLRYCRRPSGGVEG